MNHRGGWGTPPSPPPGAQPGQGPTGTPPGVQGYDGNPLASTQAALRGSQRHVGGQKYLMIGIGAFMTLSGIVTMVTTSFSGIWLAASGVATIVATFLIVPLFTKRLDDVTAAVDTAAAVMAQRAHVMQVGIPAFGRIVQVQQTGRVINFSLEVVAVVDVQHPQHGSYQAQTTALVPQLGIPYVQPGAQVQLRINPANAQDVALII